ncbi:hypothetical protein BaRGS_00024105 [Batillaria attramentaria]|uniref:Uncharacterized protein n=1 Tax=Batillaria attramentaria TaxID=370345 RepID=A0ABD0KCC5_9CAEN
MSSVRATLINKTSVFSVFKSLHGISTQDDATLCGLPGPTLSNRLPPHNNIHRYTCLLRVAVSPDHARSMSRLTLAQTSGVIYSHTRSGLSRRRNRVLLYKAG